MRRMPWVPSFDPSRRRLTAALALAAIWPVRRAGAAIAAPAETDAVHLLNRLAFGPAPGDLAQVMESGPAAYIDAQLTPALLPLPAALSTRLANLPSLGATQANLAAQYRAAIEAGRGGSEDGKVQQRELFRRLTLESGEARLMGALQSPRQLEEVLVEFWFNHFNVFSGKGLNRVLVANYEREAIRPFVLGRFRDLLGATARHPAMLFYLDNWLSAASGRGRGLNENYARELMELHTLGVDGGYTQRDVTELARIFTGWTLRPRPRTGQEGAEGIFYFEPRRHDLGDKQWLGQHVAPRGRAEGRAEGEWALDVLAAHPATARHISRKLAQQFVADDPPAALVDRLAARFTESQGDIAAVLRHLFDSPEFRDPAQRVAKFKTPYRFVVSAVRASGQPVAHVPPLLAALRQLGMPLYGCLTPDGYKNTQAAWLSPDAMARRLSLATALGAGRVPLARASAEEGAASMPSGDAMPLDAPALLATLGSAISARTRAVVAQSEPGLRSALVLGSPDFMYY